MYQVYGSLQSRTMRVLWCLEEIGQDYEHVAAGPRSDPVRALSAPGKVPLLVEGDWVLSDSVAILHYLADKHGALTHPAGSRERAEQDSLTFFILDEMDAALWAATRHSFILPEDQRVPGIKPGLKQDFALALDRLVARLGDRPFLAGDMMTIPDILAVHCGGWAINARFPVENEAFKAYAKRLRARPAFQKLFAS